MSRSQFALMSAVSVGVGLAFASMAQAQTPDQRTCAAAYGQAYTAQQQLEACTRLIQNGALSSNDRAQAYQLRGKTRAMSGDHSSALLDYGEAVRLRPVYPLAFYNRGTALNELRRFDEAIADFTRAIAQQPGYARAYVNRGNAHMWSGRLEQARNDYSEAIRFDPRLMQAWNNRGVVNRRLGDTAQADADQAEARRLSSAP